MKNQTQTLVKIIRIANEGFLCRPYKTIGVYSHHGDFTDIVITNLAQEVRATKANMNAYQSDEMRGCFCFLDGFDEKQINQDGELCYRVGHKRNIGYLPADELVFVRNVRPDGKQKIIEEYWVEHKIPDKEEPWLYPSFADIYAWIQMPLSLAVERLQEHTRINGTTKEIVSEIYLREEQVNRMVVETHTSTLFNKIGRQLLSLIKKEK
ncbi:hypothetical protein [Aneurinibacillus danicus]|jgi:hypothetical protein|uniref:Uncharacterized protein n=1 Tax=Aneurinibacillus danicus TaxID=267746 RepID=A0A511VBU6_9BACL|nr:hypothetical protein [Aneurinibacillus danicus]GEN35831.1 hypothetical protein ADA01nite_32910 [Aneurinibacillus danicus]